METYFQGMELLEDELSRLIESSPQNPKGRPTRNSAIEFGVEALAKLYWIRRGLEPNLSSKANTLTSLATDFFEVVLEEPGSAISHAVRAYVLKRRSQAAEGST